MLQTRWLAALALGLCLGLAQAAPQGRVYIANEGAGSISRVQLDSGAVTNLPVGAGLNGISYQPPPVAGAAAGYDAEALEDFLLSTIFAHALVGMRAASISLKGLAHD